jgi:hypothetical protein
MINQKEWHAATKRLSFKVRLRDFIILIWTSWHVYIFLSVYSPISLAYRTV